MAKIIITRMFSQLLNIYNSLFIIVHFFENDQYCWNLLEPMVRLAKPRNWPENTDLRLQARYNIFHLSTVIKPSRWSRKLVKISQKSWQLSALTTFCCAIIPQPPQKEYIVHGWRNGRFPDSDIAKAYQPTKMALSAYQQRCRCQLTNECNGQSAWAIRMNAQHARTAACMTEASMIGRFGQPHMHVLLQYPLSPPLLNPSRNSLIKWNLP
jgi:hypothetical protein